jgi:hypothetical protein
MGNHVHRTGCRLAVLSLAGCYLCLFLTLIGNTPSLILAAVALVILSAGLQFYFQRCPDCGHFFRGLYWSQEDAGYCRKCGRHITFDR